LQSAAKNQKRFLMHSANMLASFTLSDKMKFAIKASLSMALAYLIPFSQGWEQASTAATTVMLIATFGHIGDSIAKGVVRIIGTIVGACIGMFLVGLFPQDRAVYLFLVSLIVTVLLYLARAYKGDMAIFMLTSITIMMMFQNGNVENSFIYGVDKTYMTVLGIVIYTLVGVFLWPVHLQDNTLEEIAELSNLQTEIYTNKNHPQEDLKTLHAKMIAQEQELHAALMASEENTSGISVSQAQWDDIMQSYAKIDELLLLLTLDNTSATFKILPDFVDDYRRIDAEIAQMFQHITLAWKKHTIIPLPQVCLPTLKEHRTHTLSHLEYAVVRATLSHTAKLHSQLRLLAQKINSHLSAVPTLFSPLKSQKSSAFVWGDSEHLKGALLSFIVFWTATLFWIYTNPPGGFLIVILATALSVLTTFTPLKPSILMIILTFAFVFAAVMYIAVLPHLRYGWELGLFIFFYAFIGFYFLDSKITVFFLMGMLTLGLANEMSYNVDVFLLTLFVFYAFLFVLLFFYYIPFSTKPEHLFLTLRERFFMFSVILLQFDIQRTSKVHTFMQNIRYAYSTIHLTQTVKKMQLWADKIDERYFEGFDKTQAVAFSKACESFAYLLQMLYRQNRLMTTNPLLGVFNDTDHGIKLVQLLGEYASGKESNDIEAFWKNKAELVAKTQEKLTRFFDDISPDTYSEQDLIDVYENISLRRNVWLAFLAAQELMETVNFRVLKQNRF
jgi:hypothetical protein